MRVISLLLVSFLCACGIEIDPDSLVRELRVLGARAGDPAPGSLADLSLCSEDVQLQTLVAAPTGPGRRVTAPRPVTVDYYLCLTARSLAAPGAIDPACVDVPPRSGAAPMAFSCPATPAGQTPAPLLPLALDQDPDQPVKLPMAPLLSCLMQRAGPLLSGSGGVPGLPTNGPLTVLLPVVIRARAAGSEAMLDSETAVLFVRLVVDLTERCQAGAPPSAARNRNPVLGALRYRFEEEGADQDLQPCPAQGPCPQALAVSRGQTVWLTGSAQAGSAEPYKDTLGEARTERLRFSWFATDGKFSDERTGEAIPTTRWQNEDPYAAPGSEQAVRLYVILQDGRGGASFARYELRFMD
jgi:hypothetical protein